MYQLITIIVLVLTIFSFNLILKLYNYQDEFFANKRDLEDTYDFIIVGAGSSGLTIASSNLSLYGSVLLIEAGGNPMPYLMQVPILSPLLHRTSYDWSYETVSQSNACGLMKDSKCVLSSGKGIGGSNLLNNMIYSRGYSEDYKNWFAEEDLEKYFEHIEKIQQPSKLNYISQLGLSFQNYKSDDVSFYAPTLNQRSGRRFTIGEYFRENSHVNILQNSLVTKVVENGISNEHMVEYIKNNKVHKVKARQAVILSAGAIGTPKILLQSGYGPCNELEEIGIKCIRSIPRIGKNLQDHIATGMDLIKLNQSLGYTSLNLVNPINLFKYVLNIDNGGILSTVGCEMIGITKNREIGFMIIPTSVNADYGLKLKHVMNFNDTAWNKHFDGDANKVSILPILLHPKSRGEIKLRDSNPKSPPLVNPNYLTHPEDIDNMLVGIKLLKSFLNLNGLRKLNTTLDERKIFGCEKYPKDSDNYWKCYIKQNSFSIYHPVGTCKMETRNEICEDCVVVNANFTLKYSEALYIVDASVMPNLPSKNPNGAVQMLALRFLDNFLKQLVSNSINKSSGPYNRSLIEIINFWIIIFIVVFFASYKIIHLTWMYIKKYSYHKSTEYNVVYCRTYNQNINENYSPNIIGCIICQENFNTKKAFHTHIEDIHMADSKNNNLNNKECLDSPENSMAGPYFQITFFISTKTFYLDFKPYYPGKNISVLKVYTINAWKMVELNYLKKERYSYIDQNILPIGVKQPIFIFFKESNVIKIEKHQFLKFGHTKIVRKEKLPFQVLPQYMPKSLIAIFSKRGYCDNDLKTLSYKFHEYIEDPYRMLKPSNYVDILSNLLEMEDQHIINPYSKFTAENVIITGSEPEYSININYPKEYKVKEVIQPHDDIFINLIEQLNLRRRRNRTEYIGSIVKVKNTSITFQCRAKLNEAEANISILPSRSTVKYQYAALNIISPELLENVLFPTINIHAHKVSNISLNIYNEAVKKNPEQLQAVMNIAYPTNKKIPHIIFGPPGTGKTTTLVECIFQLMRKSQNNKILVTSGSNSACNEIGKRLIEILNHTNLYYTKLAVLRIFSADLSKSNDLKKTAALLHLTSNHVYSDHFYPSLDVIREYNVIICTLAVVGRYVSSGLQPGFFSHVFIDEAAASTETEALVGINKVLSPTSHLILSGDTKQLGAVLFLDKAKKLGLGKSLMQRLLERNCYKVNHNGEYDKSIQTRLVRNFRTHKSIISLSNSLYYNNELIPSAPKKLTDWAIGWHKLPNKQIPIIFHNVHGSCSVDSEETSSYNIEEKNIVVEYVQDMLSCGINGRRIHEKDIGIISPYKKQYTLIKEDLSKFDLKLIEIGSVETFQGKEKPIIIISTVKSFKYVGFLDDDNRINVMLSRPQALLIIIGNANTLRTIPAFDYVIEYCKSNNAFIDQKKEVNKLNKRSQPAPHYRNRKKRIL